MTPLVAALPGKAGVDRIGIDNLHQGGGRPRGFTVGFHVQHYPAFLADMREWFTTGQIAYDETVIDGLDHAVDAFLAMMRGETTGKTVVRL